MNRKNLSLLTALLLCLNFFPIQMLASGKALAMGTAQVVDSGKPEEALAMEDAQVMDSGTPPMMQAARSTGIDMRYEGFVFAQGIPIVIKENGNITSVYDTEGNLLSGSTDVSEYRIYGGWYDGSAEHSADTSIIMESGKAMVLFGGSFEGTLKGSTHVVVQDGDIEEVYGGGVNSAINGNTNVEIHGGNILFIVLGGGNNSVLDGDTNVKVDGGSVGSVYGGGYNGVVTGNTAVTINSGAQIIGNVYGGGYEAQTENTRVEINGGTMTSVFGGGDNGAVTGNTAVTINSGAQINDSVYGGSNTAPAKNTKLVFNGGSVNQIYGGGFGSNSSVTNTYVELKSGTCKSVFGGGKNQGSTVQQATITLGVDWGNNWVCAGGSFGDVTASSEIIIQNYATQSGASDFLFITSDAATDSTVVVRRSEGGPLGTANTAKFNLVPDGIKNIVVEYGKTTLLGMSGNNLNLKLDSLEIQANAHVEFNDWDSIQIQELSGSGGQILLPAHFVSGTHNIVNTPITLGKISIEGAPMILKAEGTGWLEEDLEKLTFFQGPGVDSLTSTGCFFAEGYDVILREIPNGGGAKGVYLQYKDAEEPVYISNLKFNENPVTYNETISLTVGVGKRPATADYLELIPNAHIQIRGSNSQDVLFADIRVDETGKKAVVTGVDGVTKDAQVTGGYITLNLPVNADLLNTCKEGLYMVATAPNQYSSKTQLIGPNGEKEIEITPTSIELQKTIPEPAFGNPVKSELEDGAFYTASILWHLVDGTANDFQTERDYQADVILTPKEGHWLNKTSIGETVMYDGQLRPCVFNPDGTVTLKNLKNARFEGCLVTVTASPAEGGTVTGGGLYEPNDQVTVKAEPADGWRFTGWVENGKTITTNLEYIFTAKGRHILAARFEKLQYTVTLAASPAEGGTVAGGGSYPYGSTVTIQAQPAGGWHFIGWIENSATISTDPEYTFTVSSQRTLLARFEKLQYTVALTASPAEGGAVSGGGNYPNGSTVTIQAEPADGWRFTGWIENSATISTDPEYVFTVSGNRSLTAIFEKDRAEQKTQVDKDLTTVPEDLKKTLFNTVEKIKEELRRKVTTALSGVNAICVYDVRLLYLDNGEWKDVDPNQFPPEGVIAVLPYPDGTNGTDYTFTVQHMISHGDLAGTVKQLPYTPLPEEGLQCHFTSLSPVAVGYKKIEKKPSGGENSSSGGKGYSSSGNGSSGGSSSSRNDQYDFWQQVRQKILKAKPGDTIKVNARGYDKMPRMVMDALKKSDRITLMIRWSGGKDITISSDEALNEALRIYYPLAYLTDYDFGTDVVISAVNPLAESYESTEFPFDSDDYNFGTAATPRAPGKQNPQTGGIWEINAPITAEASRTAAGTPIITNAQRGLAKTPDLASQGVEKAIPGVYEPVELVPAEVPVQSDTSSLALLALLLAAACASIWVWKTKFRNPKNSK